MAEIMRITVNWSGFQGSPGYTNLYFRDFSGTGPDQAMAQGAATKVRDWLSNWTTSLPPTVQLSISPEVEVIEETTGQMTRFLSNTTIAIGPGSGTGNYSAASGACINWYTDGVKNGRRVRGRTFMVPLAGAALGPDGTLDNAKVAALKTATQTFIDAAGSGDLGVWSRPSLPGASDGVWYAVTSFTIPDKAAVLRSRRD